MKFFTTRTLALFMAFSAPAAFSQTSQPAAPSANGGPGSTGGGGGMLCTYVDRKDGATKSYVQILDYYEATMPEFELKNTEELKKLKKMSEADTIKYLIGKLKIFPTYGKLVEEKMKELGDIESWKPMKLAVQIDAKLLYELPPGCKHIQLATRYSNNVLYRDSRYTPRLKGYQRAILRFHETVYWIAGELNDSEPIRKLLRSVVDADPAGSLVKTPSVKELFQSIAAVSTRYADVETIRFLKEYVLTFAKMFLLALEKLPEHKEQNELLEKDIQLLEETIQNFTSNFHKVELYEFRQTADQFPGFLSKHSLSWDFWRIYKINLKSEFYKKSYSFESEISQSTYAELKLDMQKIINYINETYPESITEVKP